MSFFRKISAIFSQKQNNFVFLKFYQVCKKLNETLERDQFLIKGLALFIFQGMHFLAFFSAFSKANFWTIIYYFGDNLIRKF